MFDRLIVSEPEGNHVRSRRNFFLVSTLVVAALALSAVVYDIFAEELSLGTDSFELTALVMPVDMPAAQPQPPKLRQPATTKPTASVSEEPTRQVNMSRTDEPTVVPATTSTTANTQLSRPNYTPFRVTGTDSNPGVPSGVSRDGSNGNGPGGLSTAPQVAETTPDVEPPPARHPEPPKNLPPKSLGVINGRATELPKPAYPAAALAVKAQGKVDVQVLIDEKGHVVSAKAVSGNVLLREAAERAARNARFTPTFLSNVAVKVTGVIVYNFTRG